MNKLKRLWQRLTRKTDMAPILKHEAAIIPAFVLNGVQYYQWAQPLGMAKGRWVMALTMLERFKMGCSKENMTLFLDVCDAAAAKKDLKTIQEQLGYMRSRNDWAWEPETAYHLAAVLFFDGKEDPGNAEDAYTQYKVELFKKHLKPDFFLSVPFSSFYGLTASSTADFQLYMMDRYKDLLLQSRDVLAGPYSSILTEKQRSYIVSQLQSASQQMQSAAEAYGTTI